VSDLLNNWVAVLIGALAGTVLVATALIGNAVFAPRSTSRAKETAYECGMLPIGRSIGQVHIRYYVIAILFLLFDVEAVFLFPWAATFVGLGQAGFYEMVLFIVILIGALAYAWRKGVLQWR
jgi:NADH-quinone oxidoreductase subunit A